MQKKSSHLSALLVEPFALALRIDRVAEKVAPDATFHHNGVVQLHLVPDTWLVHGHHAKIALALGSEAVQADTVDAPDRGTEPNQQSGPDEKERQNTTEHGQMGTLRHLDNSVYLFCTQNNLKYKLE